MKKLLSSVLLRYLATILVIVVPLFASTLSLGEIQNSRRAASEDCRLAHNPDECYAKQNTYQWVSYNPAASLAMVPLNTQALGLEGPFSAELKNDSTLDWILGMGYLHMFSDSFGLGTKLAGGANELRANLTGGYALTKDQQIKLTYEYLTQRLPFSFVTGDVNEWVKQHAVGLGYQYVVRHEILHSLEFSGYATRAQSKELSDITFNQQALTGESTGYLYDVNYRRIAGGKENTALASVNLFPLANDLMTLTLGAGYSDIRYDTLYEDNQAARKVAYKAEVAQLLTSKTKLTAGANVTAASSEYAVGISQLLPKKFEVSLKGQESIGNGTLPDNRNITLGFSYPAAEAYSLGGFNEVEALRNWIHKPVVYATRVLAIKDEKVERFQFATLGKMPLQTLFHGDLLSPVSTSDYFNFGDPNLQVTYSVFTQKNASDENAEVKSVASDVDYTHDLHLQLVSAGPSQSVLQSAGPVPPTDSQGQPSLGNYTVNIRATGITSDGNTLSVTQSFTLIIKSTPVWQPDFKLDNAHMGSPYPISSPDENGIDLTAQVVLPPEDMDAGVKIAFADDVSGCVLPTWLTTIKACANDPQHQCLSSGGVDVPNTSPDTHFCVAFTATGRTSGAKATQVFANTPINELKPAWITTAPIEITSNTVVGFEIPLNKRITNGAGLSIATGTDFDPTGHWALVTDNTTPNDPQFSLQLKKLYDGPTTSPALPVVATNSTSYGSESTNILVNVVAGGSHSATWNDVSDLPSGSLNAVYSINLNKDRRITIPLATTVDESNSPVLDEYTFSLSGDNSDWTLDPTGEILTHTAVSTPTTSALNLTAVSRLDRRAFVSNGNSKSFNITIADPPAFNPDRLSPSIQFNHTGDNTGSGNYPGLGTISTGINLTSAITNASDFSTLAFVIKTPNSHFEVRQETTARGTSYYLLRKATPTIAPNSQSVISAADVGTTVPLEIEAIGTLLGGQTLSSDKTFNIKVTPDTSGNISYNYSKTTPSLIDLKSATSDGTVGGGRAKRTQPTRNLLQPEETYASRSSTSDSQYDVLVSEDVATYSLDLSAPKFVHLSGAQLSFDTPQTLEFAVLIDATNTVNKNYAKIQSKANGGTSLVVSNLPRLTSSSLMIVPFRGALLNGGLFNPTQNNIGPNVAMGVGDTPSFSPPGTAPTLNCSAFGRSETTSLSFSLPEAPAGLQYKVEKFDLQYPTEQAVPTNPVEGICQGTVGGQNNSLTPTIQTPYPACRVGAEPTAWQAPSNPPAPYVCSSTTAWTGIGGLGSTNVYTFYGGLTNINRGWIQSNDTSGQEGDMPRAYEGMNARIRPGAVVGFGQDYTNYSDFPVIEVVGAAH